MKISNITNDEQRYFCYFVCLGCCNNWLSDKVTRCPFCYGGNIYFFPYQTKNNTIELIEES